MEASRHGYPQGFEAVREVALGCQEDSFDSSIKVVQNQNEGGLGLRA
jgi:hypothetical protein